MDGEYVYYSDTLGDIFKLKKEDNTLEYLKALDYRPKNMISLGDKIIIDQGNDIHIFDNTLSSKTELLAANIEQMYKHPDIANKLYAYTRDNYVYLHIKYAKTNNISYTLLLYNR